MQYTEAELAAAKEVLQHHTVEELFDKLPVVFMVGPTRWKEPEKRWISQGYYNPLWEYAKEYIVAESVTDPEMAETTTYYGSTLKEVLIETIVWEAAKSQDDDDN